MSGSLLSVKRLTPSSTNVKKVMCLLWLLYIYVFLDLKPCVKQPILIQLQLINSHRNIRYSSNRTQNKLLHFFKHSFQLTFIQVWFLVITSLVNRIGLTTEFATTTFIFPVIIKFSVAFGICASKTKRHELRTVVIVIRMFRITVHWWDIIHLLLVVLVNAYQSVTTICNKRVEYNIFCPFNLYDNATVFLLSMKTLFCFCFIEFN